MQSIDSLKDGKGHISTESILKIIPYGKEFLFLDEVVSLDKEGIRATKKVKKTESFLKAHFTTFPLMPGTLVAESIGQASALLVRYGIPNHSKKHVVVYKIKDAKFYAPVLPGQEMVLEAAKVATHNSKVFVEGVAKVGDKTIAEVTLILAIVDGEEFRQKHSR